MKPFEPELEECLLQYFESLRERGKRSAKTRELIRECLVRFEEFIFAIRNDRLLNATNQDFQKWKEYQESRLATTTIVTRVCYVRNFFDWLVSSGKLNTNPITKKEFCNIRGKSSADPMIMTAKQIFAVRRSMTDSLRAAMTFEFLLSTGVRLAEFLQIRACDVKWGNVPRDHEHQQASPYYCASVVFSPRISVGKTRPSRIVFLSVAAGRVLRDYMRVFSIHPHSPLPLHPFTEHTIYKELRPIVDKTLAAMNPGSIMKAENGLPVQVQTQDQLRTQGYRDVDLQKFGSLDPRMRKAIARRQKNELELPQMDQEDRTRITTMKTFHPHGMRHTFASIQFYRHFTSIRQSMSHVMSALGHGVCENTYRYLSHTDNVGNDDAWVRIMLGTNADWPEIWGQ